MKARITLAVPTVLAVAWFATPAFADTVTTWNSAALDAIRAERTSPPRALTAGFEIGDWVSTQLLLPKGNRSHR